MFALSLPQCMSIFSSSCMALCLFVYVLISICIMNYVNVWHSLSIPPLSLSPSLSFSLFIYLSIEFIYLSLSLSLLILFFYFSLFSFSLLLCFSFCLKVFLYLSIPPLFCLSDCLSDCPPVCLSVCLSVYLSVCLSHSPSFLLSISFLLSPQQIIFPSSPSPFSQEKVFPTSNRVRLKPPPLCYSRYGIRYGISACCDWAGALLQHQASNRHWHSDQRFR